jgi:hypothetical protein
MRSFSMTLIEHSEIQITVNAPDLETACTIVEQEWYRGTYDYGDTTVEVFDEDGEYLWGI